MSLAHALAVESTGEGPTAIFVAHGIGGRQRDWDPIVERLATRARVVTFAVAGSAEADENAFSFARHASLPGYADDIRALVAELDLRGCVYLGHSMSAMAGALATVGDPGLFERLILVNGSPCYFNDPDNGYYGGFTSTQIDQMLHTMDVEYQSWASGFGTLMMGNEDRPQLGLDFAQSLLSLNPDMAAAAFRAALTGDYRRYLPRIEVPTLILQSSNDPAVPPEAAEWIAGQIPGAQLRFLQSTGHHPHLADPAELFNAMEQFALFGS